MKAPSPTKEADQGSRGNSSGVSAEASTRSRSSSRGKGASPLSHRPLSLTPVTGCHSLKDLKTLYSNTQVFNPSQVQGKIAQQSVYQPRSYSLPSIPRRHRDSHLSDEKRSSSDLAPATTPSSTQPEVQPCRLESGTLFSGEGAPGCQEGLFISLEEEAAAKFPKAGSLDQDLRTLRREAAEGAIARQAPWAEDSKQSPEWQGRASPPESRAQQLTTRGSTSSGSEGKCLPGSSSLTAVRQSGVRHYSPLSVEHRAASCHRAQEESDREYHALRPVFRREGSPQASHTPPGVSYSGHFQGVEGARVLGTPVGAPMQQLQDAPHSAHCIHCSDSTDCTHCSSHGGRPQGSQGQGQRVGLASTFPAGQQSYRFRGLLRHSALTVVQQTEGAAADLRPGTNGAYADSRGVPRRSSSLSRGAKVGSSREFVSRSSSLRRECDFTPPRSILVRRESRMPREDTPGRRVRFTDDTGEFE